MQEMLRTVTWHSPGGDAAAMSPICQMMSGVDPQGVEVHAFTG